MADVTDSIRDGLRVLTLENEWLSLSILPEVGAKIVKLFNKASERPALGKSPNSSSTFPDRFKLR